MTGSVDQLKARIRNIPMKIDFSTDDVITPHAVLFPLPLMFEDQTIPLFAYNTETILAEKLETIISRGAINTRMRDFYDIYTLGIIEGSSIDYRLLGEALENTCRKRNTDISNESVSLVLVEIEDSEVMQRLRSKYQQEFGYAKAIEWDVVTKAVVQMFAMSGERSDR
jgi:predicted nucleotidyltransferase component of viral defense system